VLGNSNNNSKRQARQQESSLLGMTKPTANIQELHGEIHSDRVLLPCPPGLPPLPPPPPYVETRRVCTQQEEDRRVLALQQELNEVRAMLATSLATQAEQLKLIACLREQQVFECGDLFTGVSRDPSEGVSVQCQASAQVGMVASMLTSSMQQQQQQQRELSWSWCVGGSEETSVGLHFGRHAEEEIPRLVGPPGLGVHSETTCSGEPAKVQLTYHGAAFVAGGPIPSTTIPREPMFLTQTFEGSHFSLAKNRTVDGNVLPPHEWLMPEDRDDASTGSTVCCIAGECGEETEEACKHMVPSFLLDSSDD